MAGRSKSPAWKEEGVLRKWYLRMEQEVHNPLLLTKTIINIYRFYLSITNKEKEKETGESHLWGRVSWSQVLEVFLLVKKR